MDGRSRMPFGTRTSSALSIGIRSEAPGEGTCMPKRVGMPTLIRPFLEASPCRARASRGHLLPKGEGHASGFSLVNVLNSYILSFDIPDDHAAGSTVRLESVCK